MGGHDLGLRQSGKRMRWCRPKGISAILIVPTLLLASSPHCCHHRVSALRASTSISQRSYKAFSVREFQFQERLRGGFQLSTPAESSEAENHIVNDDERYRQRGMTIALGTTYLTVMGAKCALPAVLSLITSSSGGLTFPSSASPQALMARLLGLSTMAIALGKLVLGPVIDKIGGIQSLQIALSSLSLLLLVISATQPFSVFAGAWILVDFIFSSCWAGCINAIHQSFPEHLWGQRIGILAAGARTGNAVAFAMFASLLYALEQRMKQPWRVIFGVSALIQLVPLGLLTYFGRMTLQTHKDNEATISIVTPDDRPSFHDTMVTLKREAKTPEFWLHVLSRSALMVFASFLLFVPTLLSQVYKASSGFAAQAGSIYALGCLLSVTLGSQFYGKLTRKGQALTVSALMGGATLSSLMQLAHVSGMFRLSAAASAASMFLWGFCFAIPFYIPPSLYALSRGGRASSATISDVFDIGGFLLLAIFNGYVASIEHANPAAWIPTFVTTTACSLTSMISLTGAVLLQ